MDNKYYSFNDLYDGERVSFDNGIEYYGYHRMLETYNEELKRIARENVRIDFGEHQGNITYWEEPEDPDVLETVRKLGAKTKTVSCSYEQVYDSGNEEEEFAYTSGYTGTIYSNGSVDINEDLGYGKLYYTTISRRIVTESRQIYYLNFDKISTNDFRYKVTSLGSALHVYKKFKNYKPRKANFNDTKSNIYYSISVISSILTMMLVALMLLRYHGIFNIESKILPLFEMSAFVVLAIMYIVAFFIREQNYAYSDYYGIGSIILCGLCVLSAIAPAIGYFVNFKIDYAYEILYPYVLLAAVLNLIAWVFIRIPACKQDQKFQEKEAKNEKEAYRKYKDSNGEKAYNDLFNDTKRYIIQ